MKLCAICVLTLFLPLLRGQENAPGLGTMIHEMDAHRVLVLNVFENSGADIAGLQSGDLFDTIDGAEIHTKADISKALHKKKIGDRLAIQVLRGDKKLTFATQLTNKKDHKAEKSLAVRMPVKLVAEEKSGKSSEIAIGEWQETQIGEVRCCRLIIGNSSVYAAYSPQFTLFPPGLTDKHLVLNSPISLDSHGYLQQQQGEVLMRIIPFKK